MLKSEAAIVDLLIYLCRNISFHLNRSSALFGSIAIVIPSWRTNSFIIIECPSSSLIIPPGREIYLGRNYNDEFCFFKNH